MDHSKRFKILWTVWMTCGGVLVAATVYAATASAGWALVGLLGSSVLLNMIGQAVTQPIGAVRHIDQPAPAVHRHHARRGGARHAFR